MTWVGGVVSFLCEYHIPWGDVVSLQKHRGVGASLVDDREGDEGRDRSQEGRPWASNCIFSEHRERGEKPEYRSHCLEQQRCDVRRPGFNSVSSVLFSIASSI